MKTLVFLQNAWSAAYADRTWPRASWLRALHRSRSGQRLSHLVGDLDVEYHNTTPMVAREPSGVCPPDPVHIRDILRRSRPDVIVTCGNQARDAIAAVWYGAMLMVPHPAYRVLTDELYRRANAHLVAGVTGRVTLEQQRGGIREVVAITPAQDRRQRTSFALKLGESFDVPVFYVVRGDGHRVGYRRMLCEARQYLEGRRMAERLNVLREHDFGLPPREMAQILLGYPQDFMAAVNAAIKARREGVDLAWAGVPRVTQVAIVRAEERIIAGL